jgi:hypothetical protein
VQGSDLVLVNDGSLELLSDLVRGAYEVAQGMLWIEPDGERG